MNNITIVAVFMETILYKDVGWIKLTLEQNFQIHTDTFITDICIVLTLYIQICYMYGRLYLFVLTLLNL